MFVNRIYSLNATFNDIIGFVTRFLTDTTYILYYLFYTRLYVLFAETQNKMDKFLKLKCKNKAST